MFKKLFNILKKKIRTDLEQAVVSGFITREEQLRLESERADTRLKDFLDKGKKHR